MAHVLVHTAAVEDLAASPQGLPDDVVAALREDLVYARFGAVLADLPFFAPGPRRFAARMRSQWAPAPPFATLLRDVAPVSFGLRMAELVAASALVGYLPGVAVVSGWFTHLALDRTLRPPAGDLARRIALPGVQPRAAGALIERMQAQLFMEAREGRPVAGWPGVQEHLRILKRQGFPYRGIGRGLHLLIRRAAAETLGQAPEKHQLDAWIRGFYLYTRLLGSPVGARQWDRPQALDLREALYEGPGVSFPRLYDAALDRARHHLTLAWEYLHAGEYGRVSRARFLEDVPEGAAA